MHPSERSRAAKYTARRSAGSSSSASASPEPTTHVRRPFSNGTPAPRSVVNDRAASTCASRSAPSNPARSYPAARPRDKTRPGQIGPFGRCRRVLRPRSLQLDRASFHAADEAIRPDDEVPEAITFHYRAPVESGWCVIDDWTSKDARDAFMESRIRPVMEDAPLQGPPPRPCAQAPATPVSWSCQYASRSRRLSSLPAADLGSGSDRSSIVFGTL